MTATSLLGAVGTAISGTNAVGVVVDDRCTACGACLSTCPTGALRAAPLRPVLIPGRCSGCWECLEICPRDAITALP
jgi:electron transport complex protein RnfB